MGKKHISTHAVFAVRSFFPFPKTQPSKRPDMPALDFSEVFTKIFATESYHQKKKEETTQSQGII